MSDSYNAWIRLNAWWLWIIVIPLLTLIVLLMVIVGVTLAIVGVLFNSTMPVWSWFRKGEE